MAEELIAVLAHDPSGGGALARLRTSFPEKTPTLLTPGGERAVFFFSCLDVPESMERKLTWQTDQDIAVEMLVGRRAQELWDWALQNCSRP
jgi:hypothetical protein